MRRILLIILFGVIQLGSAVVPPLAPPTSCPIAEKCMYKISADCEWDRECICSEAKFVAGAECIAKNCTSNEAERTYDYHSQTECFGDVGSSREEYMDAYRNIVDGGSPADPAILDSSNPRDSLIHRPPIGAILGAIFGGIAFILLCGLSCVFLCIRRTANRWPFNRHRANAAPEAQPLAGSSHQIGHRLDDAPPPYHESKPTGISHVEEAGVNSQSRYNSGNGAARIAHAHAVAMTYSAPPPANLGAPPYVPPPVTQFDAGVFYTPPPAPAPAPPPPPDCGSSCQPAPAPASSAPPPSAPGPC